MRKVGFDSLIWKYMKKKISKILNQYYLKVIWNMCIFNEFSNYILKCLFYLSCHQYQFDNNYLKFFLSKKQIHSKSEVIWKVWTLKVIKKITNKIIII